jgi:hypothetical protein
MIVLGLGFCIYSFYSFLAYKHLRLSQIDNISNDYIKKYGLNWMEDEYLVNKYASDISKWPSGSLFSNKNAYSFALIVIISLLIFGLILFGILSFVCVVGIVFMSNILIGILLKGTGIQYSILISLICGLIFLIL